MKFRSIISSVAAKKSLCIALAISGLLMLNLPDLYGCSSKTSRSQRQKVFRPVRGVNGTSYIPLMDGTVIALDDEIHTGCVLSDRQTLILFSRDGDLFRTDKSQKKKEKIAEQVTAPSWVCDEGCLFWDKNGQAYCRCRFSDGLTTRLTSDYRMIKWADDRLTLLYFDQGGVYLLTPEADQGERIGVVHEDEVIVWEIVSNRGDLAAWITVKDGQAKLTIYDEGILIRQIFDSSYEDVLLNVRLKVWIGEFSADQRFLACSNGKDGAFFYEKGRQEITTVNLGAKMPWQPWMTDQGPLRDTPLSGFNHLYIKSSAEKNYNLYRVGKEGDRDRLLTRIRRFFIHNQVLVYENQDRDLCVAQLEGQAPGEGLRVASDLDLLFKPSHDGSKVFFCKRAGNDLYDLHVYQIGGGRPVRVASNLAFSSIWGFAESADGDKVYYLQDMEDLDSTKSGFSDWRMATLVEYDIPTGKGKKIASEVLCSDEKMLMTSGLDGSVVNPKGFAYAKYSYIDSEDCIICDLYHYDGKDSSLIVSAVDSFEGFHFFSW